MLTIQMTDVEWAELTDSLRISQKDYEDDSRPEYAARILRARMALHLNHGKRDTCFDWDGKMDVRYL